MPLYLSLSLQNTEWALILNREREIGSDWLSDCIVSVLLLGYCESAARRFDSEVMTEGLKYLLLSSIRLRMTESL